MADEPQTPGESLRNSERKLGTATTMRTIVRNYYRGINLDTAQEIRHAPSDTAAAEIVGHLRRGQASDVLLLALSAAAGAGIGLALQRGLDIRIGSVPPLAAAGVLTVAGAAVMDASLLARAFLAVGGAAYTAGSVAYTRIVPRPEGS